MEEMSYLLARNLKETVRLLTLICEPGFLVRFDHAGEPAYVMTVSSCVSDWRHRLIGRWRGDTFQPIGEFGHWKSASRRRIHRLLLNALENPPSDLLPNPIQGLHIRPAAPETEAVFRRHANLTAEPA